MDYTEFAFRLHSLVMGNPHLQLVFVVNQVAMEPCLLPEPLRALRSFSGKLPEVIHVPIIPKGDLSSTLSLQTVSAAASLREAVSRESRKVGSRGTTEEAWFKGVASALG